MCKNEQKPKLEPESCYEKRERRSHVYEKKSTGAVSFLRRLRSPGCYAVEILLIVLEKFWSTLLCLILHVSLKHYKANELKHQTT